MPLEPRLQEIVDAILAAHPQGLGLNELSDELVHRPVSYADIDEIIGALEDAGVDLDGDQPPARPEDLRAVLAAARALTAETGARPSMSAIGERAGLSLAVVRGALRFGRSLAP